MKFRPLYAIVFIATVFIVGSSTQVVSAQTPPAPVVTSIVATSSCAIEVNWTEAASSTAKLRRIRSGTSEITVRQGPPGAPFPSSGTLRYVDTYSWNAANQWTSQGAYINPGDLQQYQVGACDASNSCSWSATSPASPVQARNLPPPDGMGVASQLSAFGSSSAIRIRFTTSTVIDPGYQRFRDYGGFYVTRTPEFSNGPIQYVSSSFVGSDGKFFFNDTEADPNATEAYRYSAGFYLTDRYCSWSKQGHVVSSTPARQFVVPPAPTPFTTKFFLGSAASGTVNRVRLTWGQSTSAATYQIIRSPIIDFSDPSQIVTVGSFPAGTTSTTDSTAINEGTYYYYRITACSEANVCSFYKQASVFTTSFPVWNLKAWVTYASATSQTASVRLTWQGETQVPITIKWVQNGVNRQVTTNESSRTINDIPWATALYRFQVGTEAGGYAEKVVSLNIQKVLTGTLWAAMGDGAEAKHGVGWISLSSDTPCEDAVRCASTHTHYDVQSAIPPTKWAVFVYTNGTVGGNAFAAIQRDAYTYNISGYGWVTFHEQDLLGGCPPGYTACKATFNEGGDGGIRGWAKVYPGLDIVNTPSIADNTYSRWISLSSKSSEPPYGLFIDQALNAVTGTAWGADVIGWAKVVDGTTAGCEIPSPQNIGAISTPSSIRLSWEVPSGGYDQLTVKRVASPDVTVWDQTNVAQGAYQQIDNGLVASTTYTYRFEFRRGTQGCVVTFRASTLSAGGAGGAPHTYTFDCTRTNTSITTAWIGGYATSHIARLVDADTNTELYQRDSDNAPGYQSASGQFTQSALPPGTTKRYYLRVTDFNPPYPNQQFPSSTPLVCTTGSGGASTSTVTNLNVWTTQTSSSLHIDWGTDFTNQHTIILERIRVTPRTSTDLAVTSPSGGQVALSWRNNTNTSNQPEPSPFYHVIEWSTSSDPFTSTSTDPSFRSVVMEEANDRIYGSSSGVYARQFTVAPNENYSFRVKACSYILVDLEHHLPLQTITPDTVVCGSYSDAVSTAVPPASPTNLTVTSRSPNSVSFEWVDNSTGEDGFELRRLAPGSSTVTLASNTTAGTVSSLAVDTEYSFAVYAYRRLPNNTRLYSVPPPSAFVNARTLGASVYDLTVIRNGSAPREAGRVTSSPSGINCVGLSTGACSAAFASGTSVTLSASVAPGFSATFAGWTGEGCSGTGTCTVTMSQSRTVEATFNTSGGVLPGSSPLARTTEWLVRVFRVLERPFDFVASRASRLVLSVSHAIDRVIAQVVIDPPRTIDLNPFFVNQRNPATTHSIPSSAGSVFDDEGLEMGTVYVYRAKAIFPDNTETGYSNIAAGKTAVQTEAPCFPQSYTVRLCTRNSFCEPVTRIGSTCVTPGPDECSANADCRFVGTSRKSFEETKP